LIVGHTHIGTTVGITTTLPGQFPCPTDHTGSVYHTSSFDLPVLDSGTCLPSWTAPDSYRTTDGPHLHLFDCTHTHCILHTHPHSSHCLHGYTHTHIHSITGPSLITFPVNYRLQLLPICIYTPLQFVAPDGDLHFQLVGWADPFYGWLTFIYIYLITQDWVGTHHTTFPFTTLPTPLHITHPGRLHPITCLCTLHPHTFYTRTPHTTLPGLPHFCLCHTTAYPHLTYPYPLHTHTAPLHGFFFTPLPPPTFATPHTTAHTTHLTTPLLHTHLPAHPGPHWLFRTLPFGLDHGSYQLQ